MVEMKEKLSTDPRPDSFNAMRAYKLRNEEEIPIRHLQEVRTVHSAKEIISRRQEVVSVVIYKDYRPKLRRYDVEIHFHVERTRKVSLCHQT